ncbi:MAG: T9SS type A sorting domain-containing protein [Cryomorphaceae bacterium]
MRLTSTLLVLLFVGSTGISQVVPKVPVYEIFTSSTCPPCKPANDYLIPILADYDEEAVVVMYHMNWPGNGDPYFTSEAGSRRTYYGVNGIPSVWDNATNVPYSNITSSSIESDLAETTSMSIEMRYMVDTATQSIRIRARIEALDDYTDGAHKVYLPILEHLTTKNKETNGENEFHYVFKKMLPDLQGEIIIGAIDAGTVIEYDTTYVFNGDYRLPFNSSDQIDHEIEHSVEEFTDIYPVIFMQSLSDKEIYQGAIGIEESTVENLEREWRTDPYPPLTIAEHNTEQGFGLYPNPANDGITVLFSNEKEVKSLRVVDVTGRTVYTMTNERFTTRVIPTIQLEEGVYMIDVLAGSRHFSSSFVVSH